MTHDGRSTTAILRDHTGLWAVLGTSPAGLVIVQRCDDTGHPLAEPLTTPYDSILTLVAAIRLGLRPLG